MEIKENQTSSKQTTRLNEKQTNKQLQTSYDDCTAECRAFHKQGRQDQTASGCELLLFYNIKRQNERITNKCNSLFLGVGFLSQ